MTYYWKGKHTRQFFNKTIATCFESRINSNYLGQGAVTTMIATAHNSQWNLR